jgi:activator of HSP90 ATPase
VSKHYLSGEIRTFKNSKSDSKSIYLPFLCTIKDFKKYYIIPAPPEEVYLALTNPITLRLWTADLAEMSTEPGSEFSLWDGSIVGKNLEFQENKKIVQQWYFGEEATESVVTILLHPHPKGTSIELKHINIPDQDYTEIVNGWNDNYFGELSAFYRD